MFDLTGKTALITGASSGIGAHLAGVAARAGAHVVLTARRADRLAALHAELTAEGLSAAWYTLDVTDPDAVDKTLATITENGPIDILVNNAGIADMAPSHTVTDAAWRDVLATNLDGPFRLCRALGARWINAGSGGTIVMVGSILGLAGSGQVAAYAASKGAITALTRSLAVEWARYDIRVNALAPGYVRTDMNAKALDGEIGKILLRRIPQRRFGTVSDLSGPFLLLASDASRYMTGSVLVVDGGQTAWA